MYERLDTCPLCNSGQFHNKIIAKDFAVSGESFAIVECVNCGLNFTNPRPSENDISPFYNSEEYISHSNKSHSIYDIAYKTVRHFTLKSKLKIINQLQTKKTLMDFGCGTGHFLQKCIREGWNGAGIEPNHKAREISITNCGPVVHSQVSELPSGSGYHIITLWHVLEHIHDLQGIITSLKEHLKKKGFLVIAVPNIDSWDALHYKEYWAGYDVPRHLYHFNPKSIKTLADLNGMKLATIIPMKMDAFYISLLSEKYKYSSNKPVNAFINGIKSNKYGRKSNLYSSLIYILRR